MVFSKYKPYNNPTPRIYPTKTGCGAPSLLIPLRNNLYLMNFMYVTIYMTKISPLNIFTLYHKTIHNSIYFPSGLIKRPNWRNNWHKPNSHTHYYSLFLHHPYRLNTKITKYLKTHIYNFLLYILFLNYYTNFPNI